MNEGIIVMSVHFSGTYKRSEDEIFIDIGFDINGTKHLDASLGYSRKKFNHGYTYHPTAHLIINSERIAAISGILFCYAQLY